MGIEEGLINLLSTLVEEAQTLRRGNEHGHWCRSGHV